MRFTIFAVPALAALTSAAAVKRADYGSWAVTYASSSYANGYSSRDVTAVYKNSDLNDTITATCNYSYNPATNPTTVSSCDPKGFQYSLGEDGDNDASTFIPWREQSGMKANRKIAISLQQTVPLWGEQVTVYGEAKLDATCPDAGKVCGATLEVPVTKAIA
ncbi:hypothetical protein P280DRAFT_143807 [Massarina eburnea CBS 473.64]|uniref:AA1-like domain-containing protein n=1 Tax=Massarina eburnea CBS 473.64 TaxID=1395130 RepID=A0A6A6RR61_9PLEO|nr:hypothetical protein P280DRAFT_143807 [Massarina eburnea CBS 473.64]